MRKQLKNQGKVQTSIKKDIKVAKDQAKDMSVQSLKGKKNAEDTNNQILALKAKHEQDKQSFERKIQDL